jgi:SAM-dependent methyltransferase
MTEVVADPGSFRDPAGRVVRMDGEIYRAVDSRFASLWERVAGEGLVRELTSRSLLVETEPVPPDSEAARRLRAGLPGYSSFLRHRRVPVLTYPYEWSLSMLADAASATLEVEESLVRRGYTLKDASAFNVQFVGSRPVFVDVTSVEPHRRKDVWVAMHQFERMFLYPLLLRKYRGIDHKGYFLSHIDGMDLAGMRAVFRGLSAFRPGLLASVGLPSLLSGRARADRDRLKGRLAEEGGDPEVLLFRLGRLRARIERLGRSCPRGHWKDYARTNSYSEEAERQKVEFVRDVLSAARPASVLDLGCNTGRYSRLAAESGARVVAVDQDHDCVDLLYREAKAARLDILPVWSDLSNPSPGLGFRNRERAPLLERVRSEAVFALALVHHLLVSSRIPLEEIRDLFHALAAKSLVVEFVEPADPMFQELLGFRENLYGDLTVERFEAVFAERFRLVRRVSLYGARRTLLWFQCLTEAGLRA